MRLPTHERTKRRAAALILIVVTTVGSTASVHADISRSDLARVGVHTPADAHAPLDLALRDQDGRAVTLGATMAGSPGLLIFEDFRCKTLCGPALSIVAAGVKASGLRPGRDVRLLAVGLNPRERPADALAFRNARLADAPELVQASSFLTGDAEAIRRTTAAVGYGYAYDPATDQFTHPIAAFVLARDGRVTRVLPETALTGPDLRAAISDAGHDKVGDLVDRLTVLCHDLLPLTGRYDGGVQTGLRIAAVATLLAMAAGLVALMRRRRVA